MKIKGQNDRWAIVNEKNMQTIQCSSEDMEQLYLQIREWHKNYRNRNVDVVRLRRREQDRARYLKNRDSRIESQRKYREAHREEIREKNREYRRKARLKVLGYE